ncbi:uncharacterized protein PG998_004385 [Apiospora kogelbergensis]|uniref:uncharacterized protein n=1 Tax=Apiospora kogelbergensis TaxID=1337665 RepID=UPI003132249C
MFYGAEVLESCGAVLFDTTKQNVCLLRRVKDNQTVEFVLPKGRRTVGEHRRDAATRQAMVGTGHACHLHAVRLATRAPRPTEPPGVDDEPRLYHNIATEHFAFTERRSGAKVDERTYWYLVVADSDRPAVGGERPFSPRFFTADDALRIITFPDEREVLEEGILLVKGNPGLVG